MQPLNQSPTRPFWQRIFPLISAHFVNDFFGNVLPIILPLLKAKFDLSLALVGLVSAAYTTTSSLTQVLFGFLGDRFRAVNFILWGPTVSGCLMSLAGLMPNFALLLLIVILAGLGSAMFHPQATATAGAMFRRRRGLLISLFIASGRVGASLSPVLSAALFGSLGLTAGSWMLFGFIWVFFILSRSIPTPSIQAFNPEKDRLWNIVRPLLPLWMLVVCRHIVYQSFITYLIFLLQERGMSFQAASTGLFVFLLGGAVGSLIGGPLSDRLGRKPMVVVTFLLAFPCLWGFLHTGGIGSLIWLAIGGVLLVANNPVIVAHAQEIVPAHAGIASAITMGFGWGTGAVFVGGVGILADQMGILFALKLVSFAAPLAALLALRLVANAPVKS